MLVHENSMFGNVVIEVHQGMDNDGQQLEICRTESYELTPQHHLAELRAEAVEQAVNETKKLESTPCGQWWYCYVEDLKKYADSIRQGVK